jgi:hypothetical protein
VCSSDLSRRPLYARAACREWWPRPRVRARLEVAELEGDLLKALIAGNQVKLEKYYRKLVRAKHELSKAELAQLEKAKIAL